MSLRENIEPPVATGSRKSKRTAIPADQEKIPETSAKSTRNLTEIEKKAEPSIKTKLSDSKKTDAKSFAHKYGWGRFRPDWLQWFHKPRYLLIVMCYLAIVQGMVVNGIMPASTTQFERRFHIYSAGVGAINSMYDVGSLLMMIPISYVETNGHKGKYIGYGAAIMGLGSFVCAIPHFAAGKYQYSQNIQSNCVLNSTAITDDQKYSHLRDWQYFFMFGQLLHGIGASPLWTLAIIWMDENVKQRHSAIYVGIFQTSGLLGPAIGYMIAGSTFSIYGDLDKVDPNSIQMTKDDPRWYGAWWIGVILAGFMSWISVPVILGFAAKLPEAEKARVEDVDQSHQIKRSPKISVEKTWKNCFGMRNKLLILVKNPTYIGVTLEQSATLFVTAAIVVFLSKYIEVMFTKSAAEATFFTATAALPAAFIGTIVGTIIQRVFRLHTNGNLIISMVSSFAALCAMATFFAQCDTIDFVGATVAYPRDLMERKFPPNTLENQCNADCSCTKSIYEPVCAKESRTLFFSPCFGGCLGMGSNGSQKMAWNCSCLPDSGSMHLGLCESKCEKWKFVMFMLGLATLIFLIYVKQSPIQQAQLRCVPFELRTFAFAIGWFPMRILGTIPASPAMGAIVQSTCLLWQERGGRKEVCLLYENELLSRYVQVTGVVGFACSFMALFVSWFLYRPPPPPKEKGSKKENAAEKLKDQTDKTDRNTPEQSTNVTD